MNRRPSTETYFIANQQGLIKIGHSCRVMSRLYQLQCNMGEKLTLLAAVNDCGLERELHRKFAHLKDNGEWFKPEPELLAYIDGLNCNPVTHDELKQAEKKLRKLLKYDFAFYCDKCGNPSPWFDFLYPYFEDRCQQFYEQHIFICPSCYGYAARRSILCTRLVAASLQLDWSGVWQLRQELNDLERTQP